MSRKANPTTRTTRSQSGHNSPTIETSQIIPTNPKLLCAGSAHVFDINQLRDVHSGEQGKTGTFICSVQPCPNRYDFIFQGDLPDWGKRISKENQEELIRGNTERTRPREIIPIGSSKSSSSTRLPSFQQPTPGPSQTPAPRPPVKPEPSPEPSRVSSPSSDPHHPPTPPPYQDPPDPDHPYSSTEDSDSDEEDMSKALKAFDKVTVLKSDGSNWDTWKTRVELASRSINYGRFLTVLPETDTEKEKDSDLLNAIIGRLSDGIFRRYKHHKKTVNLWDNLLEDYDSKNALTESYLQRQLHTMRCHDPTRVGGHLDTMIEIRDSLKTRDIDINDDMFINTIIASVPDVFKPTINALVVISSKSESGKKLKPAELISTIRAESMGYIKRNQQKKESANYAGNNRGRGGFRGRGNSRGRGRGGM